MCVSIGAAAHSPPHFATRYANHQVTSAVSALLCSMVDRATEQQRQRLQLQVKAAAYFPPAKIRVRLNPHTLQLLSSPLPQPLHRLVQAHLDAAPQSKASDP